MSILSLVYGQRTASNPHARNQHNDPLLPRSFGNRRLRRKARALARAH